MTKEKSQVSKHLIFWPNQHSVGAFELNGSSIQGRYYAVLNERRPNPVGKENPFRLGHCSPPLLMATKCSSEGL